MGKIQQHATQRKQKSHRMPTRKPFSRPSSPHAAQKEAASLLYEQLEAIFSCLPDGLIACDQDGKILRLNNAAAKLLEVPPDDGGCGKDYQEFFAPYQPCDEKQHLIIPDMKPIATGEARSELSRKIITFQVPSGRRIPVRLTCAPVFDAQKQVRGSVVIFHEISPRDRYALHLQRVHEAVADLTEAISHFSEYIPEQISTVSLEESFLLSPPMVFIAQRVVEVIHSVTDSSRASLKAIGPRGHIYYVAGSGFTPEQEAPERTKSGTYTLSETLEETQVARLLANKEVILHGNSAFIAPGFEDFATKSFLIIPLFFKAQIIGMIFIVKEGKESIYTAEEITKVKVVAAEARLLMEWLSYLRDQMESRVKKQVLHEVHRLSNDFLALASHELRTPLTGILGNLQLAQRRLETLRRQTARQAGNMSQRIAEAQQPLAYASQSAQLQQHMINDIIDDARIQAHQMELQIKRADLLTLLRTVVSQHQQQTPEHPIVLEIKTEAQEVPVLIDTERIVQVFTTFLENALTYSPTNMPVTVQVTIEDRTVRVSIHNEGPGIPFEEQKHLWERFHRAKGYAIQHELDLGLGLGLYICRALIELHHGNVGVQSAPAQGATFWFTLPLAPTPK